jgi:hypothetical protein
MYASNLLHRKPPVENIRPAQAAALWRQSSAGTTGQVRSSDRLNVRSLEWLLYVGCGSSMSPARIFTYGCVANTAGGKKFTSHPKVRRDVTDNLSVAVTLRDTACQPAVLKL